MTVTFIKIRITNDTDGDNFLKRMTNDIDNDMSFSKNDSDNDMSFVILDKMTNDRSLFFFEYFKKAKN